ncbi:MAG: hypothetical protein ABI382_03405 [Nakamurella sp.]
MIHAPEPMQRQSLEGQGEASRAVSIADSLTNREWDELTDIVVRRMERTMVEELARRGRHGSKKAF